MTYSARSQIRGHASLAALFVLATSGVSLYAAVQAESSTDAAAVRAIVAAFADSLAPRLKVEPRPVPFDADGLDLEHVFAGVATPGTITGARKIVLRSLHVEPADFGTATDCAGVLAPDPSESLRQRCPRQTEIWLALSLPSRRAPSASLPETTGPRILRDTSERTVRVLALTRTPRGSVLDVFDVTVRRGRREWHIRERRHLLTVD